MRASFQQFKSDRQLFIDEISDVTHPQLLEENLLDRRSQKPKSVLEYLSETICTRSSKIDQIPTKLCANSKRNSKFWLM